MPGSVHASKFNISNVLLHRDMYVVWCTQAPPAATLAILACMRALISSDI